ncbi:MAG: septation protein SepH [Marmoricola sp.]
MTDLTPVGLSEDGTSLILVSHRGVEFSVLVDHRLRAALRGDNTRLGQLEKSMDSTLRPRDIQTRIRAGASVEEVAAAAGTTVEKLLVFAGPVIAEREHIAALAQKASLRRRTSDRATAARTLDEAAAVRLRAVNVIPEDVAWDSWRREDGRWTVVAEYPHAGTVARAVFTYDAPGRYVTAENEEAQLLTGELTEPAEVAPAAPAPADEDTAPVLASVPSTASLPNSAIVLGRAAPSGVPLGDDAIELVRPPAAKADDTDPEPSDVLFEAPPTRATPTPSPPPREAPAAPAEHASRKKGRASVPSWDEIMFGGKDD